MRLYRLLIMVSILVLLVVAAPAAAQDDSDAELVVAGWSSNPAEDVALRALLEQFTAETGISVEFIPSPDYNVTMQTAFASGRYANVFYIDSSVLPDWVEAGVVDVGEGQIEDPEGFYPSLLDIFTYEGILYCPPKDFSTMALQYNRDLFDAAGVDYPTADWTWDDLKAAAEALTDPAAGIIGLVTPAELPRWLPFLYQAGGEFVDDMGGFALDSPEGVAALEFYISFANDGTGGAPSSVDAGWGGEAFGNGRAAMAMEGNWVIQYLLENYPELNWGVAELPAGPAGKATMAFTVCFGVGARNTNPEASWDLVNFLTSAQGQISTAAVSFGPMPTRDAAVEAYLAVWGPRAEGLEFDPADIEAFIAGADYSHRWQLPVGFGPVTDAFNSALQRAFAGELTAEDVIFETSLAAEEVMR